MAKPTPLSLGRANPHVNQSRGADNYIMNFYVTNYSTAFTKPNTECNKSRFQDIPAYSGNAPFKPRSAPEHHKSGFTSNERPQIYYRKTLDNLDNPEMGRVLEDNYNTVTHIDYQPFKLNDGFEELPVQVLGQKSAFTYNTNHNPRPVEAHDLYVDTKIRAPYDVLPKHRCRLDQRNDKNPLTSENHGYGPRFMSTEYRSKFDEPKREEKLKPAVGPKQESGFVLNKEKDTITNVPGERWLSSHARPTGTSDYKDRFQPYAFPRNETMLPNIMNIDHTKESTYSKSFKPSDINPKGDLAKDTEYRDNYLGKREQDPTMAQKLGTAVLGPKEMSCQARCESGKVQKLDDPRRFITNYQIRHYDMNPKGKDREGYVVGGVQDMKEDGFSKSTKLHNTGSLNTLAELNYIDSFQSRSIRARDVFYDDHTHDHKFGIKDNILQV